MKDIVRDCFAGIGIVLFFILLLAIASGELFKEQPCVAKPNPPSNFKVEEIK